MSNPTNAFLSRYGIFIIAAIIGTFLFAFFFLKPERLVPQKCIIDGFACSEMRMSYEKSNLMLDLQNLNEKGLMVKSISLSGPNGLSCSKVFDNGWGPFVAGLHLDAKGSAGTDIDCTGISSSLVNSGNIILSASLEWYAEDSSEAYSNISKGELFVNIGP